jgi:hypothetical protein
MMGCVCVLQGMAFTLEERQALGIHGLLPPRFKTQEEQLELCKLSVERYSEDLNKYIYLTGLQVSAFYDMFILGADVVRKIDFLRGEHK